MPTAPIAAFIPQQFLDANGRPLAGGLIYTYATGTSTPLATYSAADLDPLSVRTNPIVLADDGTPQDGEAIYGLPQAYRIVVHDSDDVLVYERDPVLDTGYQFAEDYGQLQTAGPVAAVTTGYQVLATDRYVPVDSTGSPSITLPAAADFTGMLIVKNVTTAAGTVTITPDGTDTIDTIAAAYVLPISTSPIFSTVQLISNGVDAWIVSARFNP